jgi:hypothetical protein
LIDSKSAFNIYIARSEPNQTTQLTQPETADILGIESEFADVTVGGYNHDIKISPKHSDFPDINLLGSTFLALRDVALLQNDREKRRDVVFNWKKHWSNEALKNPLCRSDV